MDTNNKEHNETDLFFVLRPKFFFFVNWACWLSRFYVEGFGKPFFFFLHRGRTKLETKIQTHKRNRKRNKKQDTNETWIMFNQNPDSTFDFKKNQDSIKKFGITIKNENPKSDIKKP